MLTGLYFGSFNPIHNGHLMLANYIVEYGGISELWFVISPQNPFKQKHSLLADYHRLELVHRAIDGFKKFKACDVEFNLPKPSYTIDTLTYLKEKYPTKNFCLIIGSDNVERFNRWKNAEQIINNYDILVFPRKDCPIGDFANRSNIHVVNTPIIEISSTFIRESITEGKNVKYFLPQSVWEYIDEMNFYKR